MLRQPGSFYNLLLLSLPNELVEINNRIELCVIGGTFLVANYNF